MSTSDSDHVASLVERIGRLVRAREAGTGLNPAQWEVLRYLARANRFSRSPSAVADYLATTRGTVSQTLISLESKGLIRKGVNARDRRGATLELTDAGGALLEKADPMDELTRALAALPPLHATLLSQALSRVLDTLLAANDRKAFGVCATCRHFRHEAFPGRPEGPHQCGLIDAPLAAGEATRICAEHAA